MSALAGNNRASTVVSLLAPSPPVPPTFSVQLCTCGTWQIIVVNGEMDIQVPPVLPRLRGEAPHVVFDLLGVTFMDACALGALLCRQQSVTRSGGCMRLVAPSPVLRLLRMTGTSDAFCTFDTLAQALHAPLPSGPECAA